MSVTTAPPTTGRAEHRELRRFLNHLRLQLWWREALLVASISAVIGALVSVAVLMWPSGLNAGASAVVMAAALSVGLAVALVRRPSVVRAARVADRQLRTASRLATAAEVLDGQLGGSLAPAQLADTWRIASGIRPWRAYPYSWRRLQLAIGAFVASLAVLGLAVGGALSPLSLPGVGTFADQAPIQAADAGQPANAAAATDAQALAADQSSNPAAAAQTLEELQSQAAQSQAAETALQKLADALRPTAAARDVGDALRAGNYDDAASKLNRLAQESDQLSRLSKRELANAMARAALDSARLDPPLAVAEERVARALNRQVYSETRTSLENLARAVGDAKQGIISQEALAQELDQLQQQSQTPGGGGGDIGESDQGYIPNVPGEQPKQPGLVQGVSSTIQIPGPEGDPNKTNRSSVGQEAGGDPLGDLTSRLNVPPVDISVDTQLANDQGRNKPNPQAPTVKISDTSQNGVQPSDVVQPGEPVQDIAEQTIEPTEQRDSVRAFFKSAGESTTKATTSTSTSTTP
jgi:hypothetical protein